jgi:uncharacterized protein
MNQTDCPRQCAPACGCDCERDRHLFCPGPKRILSLDGGGVRGAVTVAFLEEIEAVLEHRLGRHIHLGQWFDLIGGTSTGAIIAGALAMGYTTADIKRFYFELAPLVFRRPFWRIIGLQAKFDAQALRQQIESIVGDRTLNSDDLMTGLCVVSKRLDTGSAWIVANNKRAPFWETKPYEAGQLGFTGNKHYSLAKLVRASTAAPLYFDPEEIPIVEGEVPGLFVDGGVTPHNNPSLALFLMATFNTYGIRWRTGPEHLHIVSVGTGSNRDRLSPDALGFSRTARIAYGALTSLMTDIKSFVLSHMQFLGECPAPWWINSEVGRLEGESPPGGKQFRFLRYDVQLELNWIEEQLGEDIEREFGRRLTEIDVVRMRSLDDPTIVEDLYRLARIAARKQVKAEHWLGEPAIWCEGQRPSAPARRLEPPKLHDRAPVATSLFKSVRTGVSYLRSWLAVRRSQQRK